MVIATMTLILSKFKFMYGIEIIIWYKNILKWGKNLDKSDLMYSIATVSARPCYKLVYQRYMLKLTYHYWSKKANNATTKM